VSTPAPAVAGYTLYVDTRTAGLLAMCQDDMSKSVGSMLELLLDKGRLFAQRNPAGLFSAVVEANGHLPDVALIAVDVNLTDARIELLVWLAAGLESEGIDPQRASAALFYALLFVPCDRASAPV
jgi:hypothetical protein